VNTPGAELLYRTLIDLARLDADDVVLDIRLPTPPAFLSPISI